MRQLQGLILRRLGQDATFEVPRRIAEYKGYSTEMLLARQLTMVVKRNYVFARAARWSRGRDKCHHHIVTRLDVSASMEAIRSREVWKSEFITRISHEMRTPLTSIIGYAEVMLSDPKLPQEAKEEYTTIIRDAGKRLSKFLDTYIESEVVERNRKLAENRREEVSLLAQRAFDRIVGAALTKAVTVALKCDGDLFIAGASSDHLIQIFENLLANAIELAPQGGHIEFIAARSEHHIQIEVINEDHGFLSISPAAAAKKFRWMQSPGIEIRHEGLGLAFAKHVVELEGGLLNVLAYKEGLAFTLQFSANSEK